MLLSRKQKKIKIKQNFQKYSQKKIDACILLASSLESWFTSPSTSNNFLNGNAEPNLLKTKEALSVLKNVSKSSNSQDASYQRVCLASIESSN